MTHPLSYPNLCFVQSPLTSRILPLRVKIPHARPRTCQTCRTPSKSAFRRKRSTPTLCSSEEEDFLNGELAHLESLEELLSELDIHGIDESMTEEQAIDEETWLDLFGRLPDEAPLEELAELEAKIEQVEKMRAIEARNKPREVIATKDLENALMQGVVPANAGVGSDSLAGDYGFDPLNLATKDWIGYTQRVIWNMIPSDEEPFSLEPRPLALVLRDYREAEIRHGRLAMLAAFIWPLQELLDRLLLDESQFGSTTMVYGGTTLPYFSLLMTAIMMLLGYLDIYANIIKDVDAVGEAFLPGDCFWDPLRMLEGAPYTMKRNMQERELLNGRMAMLAFAVYVFEEATTHTPLISIEGNELLFEPAYQIPYIQTWLDSIFASSPPPVEEPLQTTIDAIDTNFAP